MVTMLLVLSALCLLGALTWRASAAISTPIGAAAAVGASFLATPPGPLVLPVALAAGAVAAFGLAAVLGLVHPPAPQHR